MKEKDLYANNPDVYGTRPTKLVEALARLLPPGGKVLDVGAGQGRNALALAQKGFQVDAIDRSAEGIRQLEQKAVEQGVSTLRAHTASIEEFAAPAQTYDGMCFINVLHFLSAEQLAPVLARYQSATKVGGHHAITVFAEAPEGFLRRIGARVVTEQELRTIYADWSVEGCKIVPGEAQRRDLDGQPIPTKAIVFIAKKVKE